MCSHACEMGTQGESVISTSPTRLDSWTDVILTHTSVGYRIRQALRGGGGGGANPQIGIAYYTYYGHILFRKLHEKERNWT